MISTWHVGPAWIGRRIAAWMLAVAVHRTVEDAQIRELDAIRDDLAKMGLRPPVRLVGPIGPPPCPGPLTAALWQTGGGAVYAPGDRYPAWHGPVVDCGQTD